MSSQLWKWSQYSINWQTQPYMICPTPAQPALFPILHSLWLSLFPPHWKLWVLLTFSTTLCILIVCILHAAASYVFKTHIRSPYTHARNLSMVVPALLGINSSSHSMASAVLTPPQQLSPPHSPLTSPTLFLSQNHYTSPGAFSFLQIWLKFFFQLILPLFCFLSICTSLTPRLN